MFRKRSEQAELMDHVAHDHPELSKNLAELKLYNTWLGGCRVLVNGLNKIYQSDPFFFKHNKIRLGDLGCGGADLLSVIYRWAMHRSVNIELIGIDENPFMIHYAQEKNTSNSVIQYRLLNIFDPAFSEMHFDIVTLNSVCHHFSDTALIQLFRQLEKQTKIAIVVNDLQRHWLSYFSIKCLTKLINCSSLSRHDGPLSVLRAFSKSELIHLLMQAQLDFDIRWFWPFRWQVIIWCREKENHL